MVQLAQTFEEDSTLVRAQKAILEKTAPWVSGLIATHIDIFNNFSYRYTVCGQINYRKIPKISPSMYKSLQI